MRVAIVHFGGATHYANSLIHAILRQQREVLVLAPYTQQQALCEITGNDDRFRFYNKPRMRSFTNLKTIASIVSTITTFKPDVIHILEYYPWMHLFLKRLSRFSLVTTVHDPIRHRGDIESRRVPGSLKGFYSHITRFILLGEHMKELFLENFDIDRSRIDIVPHGNFLSFSERYGSDLTEKQNTILFFGRIYQYKGLEYLIEAEPLISIAIPDAQFVVAGSGSENYLKTVKEKIVHCDRFLFHESYVSDEMMARLFREASLVTLPYTEGTQSGVLMMAYAFKKPVVASAVGSLPEYVEENKTGFLVPPRDPGILAERIIQLLCDDRLRKQLGENGYRKSAAEYSWDAVAEQTWEVYRRAHGK